MKPRIVPTAFLLVVLAPLAGCGAARPARYYSLEALAPSAPAAAASYPVVLLVGRLSAPHVLRDDRIVYGTGRVELGVYEYHRWAQPPAEMLEELLLERLRATGQYKSVARLSGGARGDYLLRGHLASLNEMDGPGGVNARFAIRLELFQFKTGIVVWSQSYQHDEPVGKKAVGEVVEALQKNVRAGLDQLTADIGRYFAAHPEK
jgi:ABC-type uncharacterized transport system auxiliary subunit